jgi:dipeptide/tripeptide permease
VIGGYVAKHFGIATTLPLATAGMALGIIVALAMRETAPAKQSGGRSNKTSEGSVRKQLEGRI